MIRRRLDAVGVEDAAERHVRDAVAQIRQRPFNPVIAPGWALAGDPQNRFNNFLQQRAAAQRLLICGSTE